MTRPNVHCAPKPEEANPGDECSGCGAKCLDVTEEGKPFGRVETWQRRRRGN